MCVIIIIIIVMLTSFLSLRLLFYRLQMHFTLALAAAFFPYSVLFSQDTEHEIRHNPDGHVFISQRKKSENDTNHKSKLLQPNILTKHATELWHTEYFVIPNHLPRKWMIMSLFD